MSRISPNDLLQPGIWSNEQLDHGVIDLYTRRIELVAQSREHARQETREQMIITQPFGRPFTARPVLPPESEQSPNNHGLADLRQRIGNASRMPRRKLATS